MTNIVGDLTNYQTFNMKKLYFLLIIVSAFGYSQSKKNLNQGIYWTTDVQFALGLEKVVADVINKDNNVPFNANLGATSVVGFQPIYKIGLGAGFRYNHIFNDINNLYFIVQPKVYFGDVSDSGFVYFNAGFSLTKSDVRNARLYTLGIGDQNPINVRMNYYYSLFLENHSMNFGNGLKNNVYIGLNFGITFHSNKVREE